MDYFKSLSSAVLSSAKSGPLSNYTIGAEQVDFRGQTLWTLYSATKRDDGSQCTVLAFDTAQPHNANRTNLLPLARNAAKRLRTTRHPNVLKLLDSVETSTAVYIAVEKATPLSKVLAQTESQQATPQQQNWIVWGLSSVMNAVKFLNSDAASTHGNLRPDSVFISSSGEWKLSGFETLTLHSEASSGLLYTHASLLPDAARYVPPEVKQNGWNLLSSMDSTLLDSYSMALVAIEAFNGALPPQSGSTIPPRGHVPKDLYSMLQRMLVPNAKNRLTVAKVSDAGEAEGGFFKENTLVKVARGLDGFLLATDNEKSAILKILKEKPDSFTPEFLTYKVLPTLLGALDYTPPPGTIASVSTQASNLLPLVLRLGQPLPNDEWNKVMIAALLKAYASPDRPTRMALLDNLPLYIERMENKVVVDKVWPNLVTGFNDSVAVIREATLKSILVIAPKLSDRVLNNDLLRHLARTQVDPEAGIRTNTTILLGRLAPHLSLSTRKKVLIPAFSRSLKDNFVHARMAGLTALMATGESYDHQDAAKQVLPAVMPCLVDKEKIVRDQADKAVVMFLNCVKEGVKGMPDTMPSPEQAEAGLNGVKTKPASTSAGGAAAALAGWAVSSAFSTFASSSSANGGEVKPSVMLDHSSMDGRCTPSGISTPPPVTATASSPTSSSTGSFVPVSSSPFKNALDYDLDETSPSAAEGKDLMDVNDDTADWSSFEVGQPKKKPTSVGKTRMKAASRKTPAPAPKPVRSTPERVVSRSSLKVVQTAAPKEDAWGEAWDDNDTKAEAPAETLEPPTEEPDTPGLAASQELTANAFAEPVPATLNVDNPWAAFDSDDEDEPAALVIKDPTPPPLSKDEKKAELERKRQERRERLAQLKEEKEKARLQALG